MKSSSEWLEELRKEHRAACASLLERFPYMFTPIHGEERYDFFWSSPAIGPGWMPIFERLCNSVDQALTGPEKVCFHWTQVKQKWGGFRAYWMMIGRRVDVHIDVHTPDGVMHIRPKPKDEIGQRIERLIIEAEREAAATCEICGHSPARLDRTRSYVRTLCEEHIAQQQKEVRP